MEPRMEGEAFSGYGERYQMDGKVLQNFQKRFGQVQDILDQNRLLINEINQNHESKQVDHLGRNVGLIRELNNNIRTVASLYGDLSHSFARSVDASSEGESTGTLKSDGKANNQKRYRSGATFGGETTVKDKTWLKMWITIGHGDSYGVPTTNLTIKDDDHVRATYNLKDAPSNTDHLNGYSNACGQSLISVNHRSVIPSKDQRLSEKKSDVRSISVSSGKRAAVTRVVSLAGSGIEVCLS